MFKLLFSVVLVFLFFSCKQPEEKVVGFDDIARKSKQKENNKASKPIAIKTYYETLDVFSKQLIDSLQWTKEQIFPLDSVFFSDRFGAEKTTKWYYKSEQDSLVFFRWSFKDSIKTLNTFYNWMDCFGPKCRSIRVGDQVKFSPRSNLFLLQNKELFFIESKKAVDFERVFSVFDTLQWNKQWRFVVFQAPRKKSNWMTRNSLGELLPIQK
jgi:hypothetical protein